MERRINEGDLVDSMSYLWAGLGGLEEELIGVWFDQFREWSPDRLQAAVRRLKAQGWYRTYPQPADLWRADGELKQEAARERAEKDAERRLRDHCIPRYKRGRDKPGLLEMFYELRASVHHQRGEHGAAEKMERLAAEEKARREAGKGASTQEQLGALVGAVGKKF